MYVLVVLCLVIDEPIMSHSGSALGETPQGQTHYWAQYHPIICHTLRLVRGVGVTGVHVWDPHNQSGVVSPCYLPLCNQFQVFVCCFSGITSLGIYIILANTLVGITAMVGGRYHY